MSVGKTVRFASRHEPPVAPGNYKINMQLDLQTGSSRQKPEVTHNLTVTGDRFVIGPEQIRAVFPPRGSLGDYANTLAHVVFHRSTLPWERVGNDDRNASGAKRLPWLAVLIFDEADPVPDIQTTTIGELHKLASACAKRENKSPRYHLPDPEIVETGHAQKTLVSVIDVPPEQLRDVMPATKEIKLLSHVRRWQGGDADDTGAIQAAAKPKTEGELAVLVGTRLPRKGQMTTVHVVSVEGRFDNGGKFRDLDQNAPIRLVSLLSWSFTCRDETKSFTGLIRNLDRSPDRLALPKSAVPKSIDAASKRMIRQGFVPMPHRTRWVKSDIESWYRGPLAPLTLEPKKPLTHVEHSENLVRLSAETGMLDASYAAAWEIGRFLTLQHRTIARALFHWKRDHIRAARDLEKRPYYLPFRGLEGAPKLPVAVADWFAQLQNLHHVPFDYLVVSPSLLPTESLRLFTVDPLWIEALLMGAFSVGRTTRSDLKIEQMLHQSSCPRPPRRSGLLIRSDAVAGWPDLVVTGYSSHNDDDTKVPDTEKFMRLRHERLSDHVLLVIFDGTIGSFDIGIHPEGLHFGFNKDTQNPTDPEGYFKQLRTDNGVEQLDEAARRKIVRMANSKRRINIAKMAKVLGARTSADFALQMIEGVERLRFNVSTV